MIIDRRSEYPRKPKKLSSMKAKKFNLKGEIIVGLYLC